MMIENILTTELLNNSFAIFIAIYFIWRLEKKMDKYSNRINELALSIDKQSKTILLLILQDDNGKVKEQAKRMLDDYDA